MSTTPVVIWNVIKRVPLPASSTRSFTQLAVVIPAIWFGEVFPMCRDPCIYPVARCFKFKIGDLCTFIVFVVSINLLICLYLIHFGVPVFCVRTSATPGACHFDWLNPGRLSQSSRVPAHWVESNIRKYLILLHLLTVHMGIRWHKQIACCVPGVLKHHLTTICS